MLQMSELTDACEALTLDKEQLALENEELQASWLGMGVCVQLTLVDFAVCICFPCAKIFCLAAFSFLPVS